MASAASTADRGAGPDYVAPAFVVGMPRAATRWLCRCLNEHPDVAAFGETLFWGRWYVPPQANGRYTAEQLRRALDHLRTGFCVSRYSDDAPGSLSVVRDTTFSDLLDRAFADAPGELTPGEVFQRVIDAIGHAEGASLVVEKTPHHLNWIDRIVTALPTARFIIMIREPYSFMLSYKHQGDRQSDRVRKEFRRRYHPMVAAIIWRNSMIAAMAARRDLPDQTLIVVNETLRTSTNDALAEVQRFLGLPVEPISERVPPVNTSFPDGLRPDLAPDDVFWMNRVAGGTMRKYGYAMQPVPFAPWPILRSFLVLPIWGFRNLISMRRIVDGSLVGYLWRWLRPAQGSRAIRAKGDQSPQKSHV